MDYDYGNDDPSPTDTDLRMPVKTMTLIGPASGTGSNRYRVSDMSHYVLGKPQDVNESIETLASNGSVSGTTPLGSTTSTYDSNGNLTSSTDNLSGLTTVYTYTLPGNAEGLPVGLLLQTYRVKTGGSATNSSDLVLLSSNTYYTANNELSGAIRGKVASTEIFTSDSIHQTTNYAYDAAGNVVLTWTAKTWSKSDGTPVSGWTTTATAYDLAGRVTDTYTGTYLGTGTLAFTVSAATATSAGNVTITSPLYDDATQSQAAGVAPLHTHTDYTPDGQVKDTVDQYGRATTNRYDSSGNLIETINADGTVVETTYDALGRAVLTTDLFVPGQSNPVLATQSVYDSLGRIVETDRLSGVSLTVAPDTGYTDVYTIAVASAGARLSSTSTVYNADDTVVYTIGTDGQKTGYTYDGSSGRQRTVTTAAGTADASMTTYAYDQTDGPMPTGAVTYDAVTDALGHTTKTYKDGSGRSVETLYDDGSFTQTLYSDGDTPITGYSSFTIPPGGSETVSIAQRKTGDPIEATIRIYDRAGRLTDVYLPSVPDALNGNASTRPHWIYAYDASGNEISQTDPNGHVTTFAYDENGNQVSRTLPGGQTEHSVYNPFGQLVTHTDSTNTSMLMLTQSITRIRPGTSRALTVLARKHRSHAFISVTILGIQFSQESGFSVSFLTYKIGPRKSGWRLNRLRR